MISFFITTFLVLIVGMAIFMVVFSQYKKTLREAKNYERGLKMVPMYIHIPPSSDDLESNGRDERDITEEILSQAQVMYNIISSTAVKGFKSKVFAKRIIRISLKSYEE